MNLIDEKYTSCPFYGRRRMTLSIADDVAFEVNEKRVARLMKEMGIRAIYPKKNLSKSHQSHKKYPYLLGEMDVTKANQAWAIDITYIRLEKGFAYMVAMIDWYSRKILSWRLTNTLGTEACIDVLEEALRKGKPEIINSDQGVQFTSSLWVSAITQRGISISMDGKGRAFDNIFIERFWRSLKYEDIYLRKYRTIIEAREGIRNYIAFYNTDRKHMALNYRTPDQVHYNLGYKNGSTKDREEKSVA